MNNFIKKNINIILVIFILLAPILDLITGIQLHTYNNPFTIGIILRTIFLILICIISLFVYKKKKLLIPYSILIIYFILFIIGNILYKDSSIVREIQGIFKTYYFIVLLISLYPIKDNIHISTLTLTTTLFIYLILIFIPELLGVGYKTYEITKSGTLGFFNSANEISGIISILTPIMFIVLYTSNNKIPKILLSIIYIVVILMMGTKTPLLSLIITIFISLIYYWIYSIKNKKYKNITISVIILLIGILSLIIILPKTNFYKNIETHLHYLKLNSIEEVFTKEKYIDHFIFSSRLKFLRNKYKIYNKSNIYQKLFGIGYINNNKTTKMIEIDYFDILLSNGIIGFIIYFIIYIYILYKILSKSNKHTYKSLMYKLSLFLILILSFFTGHIITSPSVSYLVVIIILGIYKRNKKRVLITDNKLIHSFNKDYEVYLLEDKKVNNKINILIFKILEYKNFDYSISYNYMYSKEVLSSSEYCILYIDKYKEVNKDIKYYNKIFFSNNKLLNTYTNKYNIKNKTIINKYPQDIVEKAIL